MVYFTQKKNMGTTETPLEVTFKVETKVLQSEATAENFTRWFNGFNTVATQLSWNADQKRDMVPLHLSQAISEELNPASVSTKPAKSWTATMRCLVAKYFLLSPYDHFLRQISAFKMQ
jgi:LytS/YehU family sensor histidine kinase